MPRPKRQIVGAGDQLEGVDLDRPEAVNRFVNGIQAGGWFAPVGGIQLLSVEGQGAQGVQGVNGHWAVISEQSSASSVGLFQEEQGHAANRNQRAEDGLPVELFFVEKIADRQHNHRRESHQRAGHADLGVLDRQQGGRNAENRAKKRAKDGPF